MTHKKILGVEEILKKDFYLALENLAAQYKTLVGYGKVGEIRKSQQLYAGVFLGTWRNVWRTRA